MTVRFGNWRIFGHISVLLLSGAVLGLAAHFAAIFLPNLHHDFSIFALIVPCLTIFVLLLSIQWAQPRSEAICLFFLGVLWLALAAWSADIIGNVQCDSLGGITTPTKTGSTSLQSYCYEMKVIEAFSWMIFVLFTFFFIILLTLVTQAQRWGRPHIWEEPIRELGWFGELPGYYNTHQGGIQYPVQYPGYYPGQGYNGYPMMPAQYQQGSSIVIQPSANGGPATVTHVPMGAV